MSYYYRNKWGDLRYKPSEMLPTPDRKASLSVEPAGEPVSLTLAKKHLEVSGSDHDAQIAHLIEAARRQWEHDTSRYSINQTWVLKLDMFYELRFNEQPVSSISSITYYDTANSSQTLSTDIYELDAAAGALRLKADQEWPGTYERWDAVTITYVVGGNADNSTVSSLDVQAMLLLVGYYFENRDMYGMTDINMGDATGKISAYEALVRRACRSSYP